MYFDFATWLRIARLILSEPFRWKRALFLWGVFSGLTVLSIINMVLLGLDVLVFPRLRKKQVEAPIFIVGNGRSGTTHIHRILSADGDRFSFFKTWELLAPSLIQHKIVDGFDWADRRLLGGWIRRRLQQSEDGALDEIRKLHDWQSTGSEEDDFVMFANWSSVSLTFPFPYPELEYLFWTDREPEAKRRRILNFYAAMLKRLLYAREGPGRGTRIHCSKSPQFTLKMRGLLEQFPDARFIVMLRHPNETIPSLLDLMSQYWRGMGASPDLVEGSANLLGEIQIEQYKYAVEVADSLPENQRVIVEFRDLLSDPKRVVENIYDRFGLEMSKEFDHFLDEEREAAKTFKSEHEYELAGQGPERERVERELSDLFDRFDWPRKQAGG
jgi:hypothetical protein